MRHGLFLIVLFYFISGCNSKENNNTKKYLFLSHIYQWGVVDNNRIDYRLKDFDFKKYDQIWLGGDLCARTSEKVATINYLDSIFDLSSKNTFWAIGNHDLVEGDVKRITDKTKRKSFFATFTNGIGVVVLNTSQFYHPNYQPKTEECGQLDGQIELLKNIADTITHASHLIVLHHNTLLSDEMTKNALKIGEIFNFYHPELLVSCQTPSTFEKVLYPIFQKIQQKGVQTILVGGDLGQRSKEFEYRSQEGIYFLGSGINNSASGYHLPEYVTDTSPDKLLIFHHNPSKKELSWEFVELSKLTEENEKSSKE